MKGLKDITFQPNSIPALKIRFVEEFFRFKWFNNTFDLKLLICYNDTHGIKELSLRDFWEKTDRVVKWKEIVSKATESMYEFGYTITDIPLEIAANVEYLIWKIEGSSFEASEVEIEIIEPLEQSYNITRFHLPDNLVLSYEDLWLYNFSVTHLNKFETKVEGVKGKTEWNLDPIIFSGGIITIVGQEGLGDTEENAYGFQDIYNSDDSGTLTLEPSAFYSSTTSITLDQAVQPADKKEIRLAIDVTTIDESGGDINVTFSGRDQYAEARTENVDVSGLGISTTDYHYNLLLINGVTFNVPSGSNITAKIFQTQWGVVHRNNANQFAFDARIIIGDGLVTTWFADTDKQVVFSANAPTGGWQYLIQVANNAHFRVGTLLDATERTTWEGCSLSALDSQTAMRLISVNAGGELLLFSSMFVATAKAHSIQSYGDTKIYNCMFGSYIYVLIRSASITFEMFNLLILNDWSSRYTSPIAITAISDDAFFDKITITDSIEIFNIGVNYNATLRNIYSRKCGRTAYLGTNWSGYAYLIDIDSDVWSFSWHGGIGKVYRQYTFKINVTDTEGTPIENANVTLVDIDEIQEFSVLTGVNGSFAVQNVNFGFYNQTGGNTPYMKTPHNLTISHSSYTTLSYRVTIDEWKTVVQVVLGAPRASYGGGLGSGFILGLIISLALGVAGVFVVGKRRS